MGIASYMHYPPARSSASMPLSVSPFRSHSPIISHLRNETWVVLPPASIAFPQFRETEVEQLEDHEVDRKKTATKREQAPGTSRRLNPL